VSDPAPPIADGADHRLDPLVIALERTVAWIVTAVLAAISLPAVFIIWLANGLPWLALIALVLAWALVVAVLGWHAHYWPPIAYRYASYRVDELGIEIRRGVYWRSAINVPRSRVQHTDVSQGPLERQHGLATLVVYTAGTDHSKVDLGGLDHAVALRIREHLLPPGKSDAV